MVSMWEDKSTHKFSTSVVDDSRALIQHFLDPMVHLAKIIFMCFGINTTDLNITRSQIKSIVIAHLLWPSFC